VTINPLSIKLAPRYTKKVKIISKVVIILEINSS